MVARRAEEDGAIKEWGLLAFYSCSMAFVATMGAGAPPASAMCLGRCQDDARCQTWYPLRPGQAHMTWLLPHGYIL